MRKAEKLFLITSFLFLLAGILIKGTSEVNDKGVYITLTVLALVMWVIFAVISFFPADLRMSQKQREKITDIRKLQRNYQRIMIATDWLIAVVFVALINILC